MSTFHDFHGGVLIVGEILVSARLTKEPLKWLVTEYPIENALPVHYVFFPCK
jgi:hypothetical protein